MQNQWKLISVAASALITGALIAGVVMTLPNGARNSDAYADQVASAQDARANLDTANHLSTAFRNVAEAMRPSVVSVRVVKQARMLGGGPGTDMQNIPPEMRRFMEEFGMPFGGRGRMQVPEQSGIGSGVIVRSDGYILTNNHVVQGADEVRVQLSDGRDIVAEVVGTDPDTDLAVLKIEGNDFAAAPLGDSDAISVGDWVLAMGSPFELEQTVTAGIISAKNRVRGIVRGGFEDFLQTDAAINPGNSGGPLVNLRGEVVGINTAILSRSGGYNGIGFAIPTTLARPVLESIIDSGEVQRGFLGAQTTEDGEIPQEVKERYGLTANGGAYIKDVVPGGPAERGGLRAGDVIQKANGRDIRDWFQFRNFVASQRPGETVALTLLRDGETVEIEVTLGERSEAALAQMAPNAQGIFRNALLQPLTAEQARSMGFENVESGLLVLRVQAGADNDVGLQPGDVIIAAQGEPVSTLAGLLQAEERAQESGQALRLTIQRGDSRELLLVQ